MTEAEPDNNDPYKRWEKFTDGSCEFFFYQAEKMLETTIEVTDSFQSRAMQILAFYVPTIIAIAAYVAINLTAFSHSIPLAVILMGMIKACLKYQKILKSKVSYRVGSLPEKIIVTNWLELPEECQKKAILLNECRDYQVRIKQRIDQNIKEGKLFDDAIEDVQVSLIVAFLAFIALTFFIPLS